MTSLLLFGVLAFAGEANTQQATVKPSATIFFHYGYLFDEGAVGANEFSFDRGYFRLDGTVNERFSGRLTLDADHMKPAELGEDELTIDTKYRLFVKHAYLEAKDLGPLKVRAGIVDTPYAPYYDSFWGNRYIAKSMVDEHKVLDTADLGVAVLGEHAGGMVDWNLSLLNGEGYGKLESDAGKAVQARVTLDPLAKTGTMALPVTGFASYSGDATEHTPVFTWAGAAGFQREELAAWAEVVGRTEGGVSGLGYSATLNPRLPKVAGLVARYDRWDADGSVTGDALHALVGGVEKDFTEKVSVAVTYERSWVESAPDAPGHGMFARMQAGF
jgi:hypothetical protein